MTHPNPVTLAEIIRLRGERYIWREIACAVHISGEKLRAVYWPLLPPEMQGALPPLHPQDAILAEIIDLRRKQRLSWRVIAEKLGVTYYTVNTFYRPLVPDELRYSFKSHYKNGESIRVRVYNYLDENGDCHWTAVVAALEIADNTAQFYLAQWRKVQNGETDPEPPARCVCGIELWNGEVCCTLCAMAADGLLITYTMDLNVLVEKYVDTERT